MSAPAHDTLTRDPDSADPTIRFTHDRRFEVVPRHSGGYDVIDRNDTNRWTAMNYAKTLTEARGIIARRRRSN